MVAVVGLRRRSGGRHAGMALATATGASARVVAVLHSVGVRLLRRGQCRAGAEGLARGSRGDVLLERPSAATRTVPVPTESSVDWTFVDTDWTTVSGAGAGWLGCSAAHARRRRPRHETPRGPGVRRLESCVELLGRDAFGVVVGPTIKRSPRPVRVQPPRDAAARAHHRLPLDSHLPGHRPDSDPLPARCSRRPQN